MTREEFITLRPGDLIEFAGAGYPRLVLMQCKTQMFAKWAHRLPNKGPSWTRRAYTTYDHNSHQYIALVRRGELENMAIALELFLEHTAAFPCDSIPHLNFRAAEYNYWQRVLTAGGDEKAASPIEDREIWTPFPVNPVRTGLQSAST